MQSISVLAVLALAFSCTLALDVTLNQHWKLWKSTHNKQYFDGEEHVRYETFPSIFIIDFSFKYEIIVVLFGKVIYKKFKNITSKLILVFTHIGSE